MKVSFFLKNIKNTTPDTVLDIIDFLNLIKYGEFKQQQLEIASITDKKARQKRKAEILPYITPAGVFNTRSKEGLLSHSGLIGMDFDDMDNFEAVRNELAKDPYTFALFNSVSGTGFCVLAKITPDEKKHLAHFNWLSRYYYEKYGLVIDAACKDAPRARFVSYDPNVAINYSAKKAGVKQERKAKPKQVNFIATESQMDRIVSDISSRGINITESYEDYLKVGMSIASEYGETGRNYFHAVASMSSKYNPKECDKKYTNCIKTSSSVKIGSFLYMAKQAGVELYTEEERKAYGIALAAKKSRSTIEGAVKTAVTIHGIPKKIIQDAGDAVFKAETDIYQNDEDTPVIEQITNYLDINHTFKKNEITRVIEDEHGREMDEQFENTMYIKAKALIGNKVVKKDIECIINSDRTEVINPFKEFYEKHNTLPDKPEIIDEFISGLKSDTPNFAYWVRKWLLGIPASINGETVRIVLVLCGKQNNGKTFWFRMLLPAELKKYYAESKLDRGKDDEILMTQNLIVMNDEFDGFTVKSAAKFKDLISKQIFSLREPYGKRNVQLKRLALIAGTANDDAIINDTTGNSRIIPINVNEVDFNINESIDRTQLFVELMRAYERGESWKLTKEDLAELGDISENHESTRMELELLQKYFEPGDDFFTVTDIKEHIEKLSYLKTDIRILGLELKNLHKRTALRGKRGYRLRAMGVDGASYTPRQTPNT